MTEYMGMEENMMQRNYQRELDRLLHCPGKRGGRKAFFCIAAVRPAAVMSWNTCIPILISRYSFIIPILWKRQNTKKENPS